MATPNIVSTTARVEGLSLDDNLAAEEASLSPSAERSSSTPRTQPSATGAAFVFGSSSDNGPEDTTQDSPFTFHAVFNATPQPSRAPSAEPQNVAWDLQLDHLGDWSSILSTPPQYTPDRPRSTGASLQATPNSHQPRAFSPASPRASSPLADQNSAWNSVSSTPSPHPLILTPSTILSGYVTASTSTPVISIPVVQPPTPVAELSASTTQVHPSVAELLATTTQALPSAIDLPAFSPPRPTPAAPATARVTPVIPYDPRDETTPSHALFEPALQDALKNGCRIGRDAATAITKANIGPDSDLQQLLGEAERLQNFHGSDTRTIAVLGDSGEGKSSLINSILHVPGLAFTSDTGSACTSIATEYRQKKPEQVAPFTVEVEYLSATEIEEHIRELLWNYRRLYLPDVNSQNTTEADYRKYERESELAWFALEAAFKHKGSEFTPELVKDMSDGAEERVLHNLTRWANSIQWPQSSTGSEGADGFWTETAEMAQECVELTKKFMHDRYWPFTKIIRIYLSSQVLKTGVVLTDLPGLHDINLARVRITQDYLLRCDNVLIVAKISRAVTDQSLRSSLFLALSRHVPTEWETSGAQKFKIAVVCTRTEDINLTAARAEFVGEDKRIAPETMARLDREIAAARLSGDRDKKKAAKREQEMLLIRARNDHVREGLQQTYASETNGEDLHIFCVSNKWYEKYCPKGNTALVRASEIPELRRFCHTVAADAMHGEAMYFLRSKLSSLLNSLDLWATSSLARDAGGAVFDSTAIYREAKEVKKKMFKLATKLHQSLGECFQEQIFRYFEERGHAWTQTASNEGRQWMTWHHSQYNAWCQNDGDHATAKRNHVNWNAQIIWKMRMELEFQWDLVEEQVKTEFARMFDSACKHLKSLQAKIQEAAAVSPYVDALVQSIKSNVKGLKYKLDREERDFLREVRAKRRYTSEANSSSYIAREMRPKYRSAASQSGTGRMARQHTIVQGHIQDDILFELLGTALSTEMDDLFGETQSKLHEIVKEVFGDVMSDIDLAFAGGLQPAQSTVRDESAELRLREFADTVKKLRERHESLLVTITEH